MSIYLWNKPSLPSTYQEVEYIESSGQNDTNGQYINTGVIPNSTNTTVKMRLTPTSSTYSVYPCGVLTASSNGYYYGVNITSNRWHCGKGDAGSSGSGKPIIDFSYTWNWNSGIYDVEYRNADLYVNNVLVADATSNTTSFTYPMFLFGRNGYGTPTCASFRMYSCQIYQSDVLIRDFVPCYRKSDDEIGLYDLVNDQFYTNSGTGTFSKGADVLGEREVKNVYIGLPYPDSIVLDKNAITLTTVGQTYQLTAIIEPTVSDKTITWTTSNPAVATVSATGLVTCVTPGECTITATTVNGLTATCAVKETLLPNAYQEVEYIQSSGTQYVNTLYTPSVNTEIETDIQWGTQSTSWAAFFGVTGNDSSSDGILGRIYSSTSTNFNPWFCNATYGERQITTTINAWHTIKLKSGSCVLDGTSYTITTSGTPYNSSIDLFAGNNGGTHGWRASKCSIKTFKIYENGTLVRDFIPCYRKLDTVIGLYDLVNNVFYTNSGTGTFTKGPDVN